MKDEGWGTSYDEGRVATKLCLRAPVTIFEMERRFTFTFVDILTFPCINYVLQQKALKIVGLELFKLSSQVKQNIVSPMLKTKRRSSSLFISSE